MLQIESFAFKTIKEITEGDYVILTMPHRGKITTGTQQWAQGIFIKKIISIYEMRHNNEDAFSLYFVSDNQDGTIEASPSHLFLVATKVRHEN